jgi:hypothetical protein
MFHTTQASPALLKSYITNLESSTSATGDNGLFRLSKAKQLFHSEDEEGNKGIQEPLLFIQEQEARGVRSENLEEKLTNEGVILSSSEKGIEIASGGIEVTLSPSEWREEYVNSFKQLQESASRRMKGLKKELDSRFNNYVIGITPQSKQERQNVIKIREKLKRISESWNKIFDEINEFYSSRDQVALNKYEKEEILKKCSTYYEEVEKYKTLMLSIEAQIRNGRSRNETLIGAARAISRIMRCVIFVNVFATAVTGGVKIYDEEMKKNGDPYWTQFVGYFSGFMEPLVALLLMYCLDIPRSLRANNYRSVFETLTDISIAGIVLQEMICNIKKSLSLKVTKEK